MKKSGGIRKKIRMGVKQKILIPVMIVSLVVCVGLGVVLGSRMANVSRDLAAQQALAAARFTAKSIDYRDLLGLQPGDEGGAQYQTAAAALDRTRAEEKVCEISEACSRQAQSTEQINQNIAQITGVVQENSALAEETAATCEQLSAQTQSVDMLMKRFKVEQRSVYGGF